MPLVNIRNFCDVSFQLNRCECDATSGCSKSIIAIPILIKTFSSAFSVLYVIDCDKIQGLTGVVCSPWLLGSERVVHAHIYTPPLFMDEQQTSSWIYLGSWGEDSRSHPANKRWIRAGSHWGRRSHSSTGRRPSRARSRWWQSQQTRCQSGAQVRSTPPHSPGCSRCPIHHQAGTWRPSPSHPS